MADRHRKEQIGTVLNNKMEQAVVVQVTRLVQHSVYRKVIRRRKKYVAHDGKKMAKIGDKVRIKETRPMSRTKRWQVVEVLTSLPK